MNTKKCPTLAKCSSLNMLLFLLLLGTLFAMGCTMSQAQDGWLDKGKKMMDDLNKGEDGSATSAALSVGDINAGLKDALKVGTENVVTQLGKPDGFNADSAIHIPLPEQLASAKALLDKAGMGGSLDDLELQLNRAAEAATPKAKQLFWTAITEMSIDDAKQIYNGPENAATEYFKSKMAGPLQEEMRPVVSASLAEVGAVKTFDTIISDYQSIPFAPDIKADLTDYTVEKGIDGIFYYLAKEEAAIRANPAARTTDLLKKVFGTPQ